MLPVERWLSSDELKRIYSSEYWNDIEIERKKEWWIDEKGAGQLLSYLESSGLQAEFNAAKKIIAALPGDKLIVADLAAGTGWASALLTRIPRVARVHAVEISDHRIGELFEKTFRLLDGDEAKIRRYLGSFYSLNFSDSSIDVAFLSQAFHHADKPFFLLMEIHRVLKQGGSVILAGEHFINFARIIKRFIKSTLIERKPSLSFYSLFPPDPVLGDHYYRISDYYFLAYSLGFKIELYRLDTGNAMYILTKT